MEDVFTRVNRCLRTVFYIQRSHGYGVSTKRGNWITDTRRSLARVVYEDAVRGVRRVGPDDFQPYWFDALQYYALIDAECEWSDDVKAWAALYTDPED
jgi:hypothetical protein